MITDPVPARTVWAALQLLDRQLRDRDGNLCGNVDDVELLVDDDTGVLYAAAVLSGPGRLVRRFGGRRLGRWLVRFATQNSDDGRDPTRIPFQYVHTLGPVIELAYDAARTGSYLTERWTRDHVISHIIGNRHEPE